ncbi:universal stress protein [Nocardia terpenica]|uniref:Universal stress protein n=1 Tax=Nocardia terpenica TaxID=455432 RepID=A0A6G9Z0G5_9NOCA|nr:universal stress protein [Nocardia terpenica]QIS18954.1 universal stress protein [Nocardia terpenica]
MTDNTQHTEPNPPIVAAVDGSDVSYQAAGWAATEAVLHGCRLHLVNSAACPPGWGPGAMFTGADLSWLHTDAERVLTEARRVAREIAPESQEITTEVVDAPIIPDLIERSRSARMLVVGSRGLGAFGRGLLGSVSSAVARHAHCPVAVVHGRSANDPAMAAKPVLVGIDGSEVSAPAVGVAFEEAARRKVGLTALHAWSDVSAGLDVPMVGWDEIRETEDAVLAENLAGWSERYPEVPVHRILARDRPVRALVDEAETAQLLVVGSHGRGGFTGMLLGSTSSALLHSVECPTLVVRKA